MEKKYIVELSKAERLKVFETLDTPDTPKTLKRRCMVLLLADTSAGRAPTQAEMAARCGVSDICVYHTIKGYCLEGLGHALRRREHENPPRRAAATGEEAARIIALACSEPPAGYARWTLRLLTERVVELRIVPSIGREAVRGILKKTSCSLTSASSGASPRGAAGSSPRAWRTS